MKHVVEISFLVKGFVIFLAILSLHFAGRLSFIHPLTKKLHPSLSHLNSNEFENEKGSIYKIR